MADRRALSEQSIGFILKVESDAALKDLKKGEKAYERLDKAVRRTAETIVDRSQKIADGIDKQVKAMQKLGKAGGALTDPDGIVGAAKRGGKRGGGDEGLAKTLVNVHKRERREQRMEKYTKQIRDNTRRNAQGASARSPMLPPKDSSSSAAVLSEALGTKLQEALDVRQQAPAPPRIDKDDTNRDIVEAVNKQTDTMKDFLDDLPTVKGVKPSEIPDAIGPDKFEQMVPKTETDLVGYGRRGRHGRHRRERQREATLEAMEPPKFTDRYPMSRGGRVDVGEATLENKGDNAAARAYRRAEKEQEPQTREWLELLKLLPDAIAMKAAKAFNTFKVAIGQADKASARFFNTTLTKGNIARFTLLATAISVATIEADEFEEAMHKVRRVTGAAEEEMKGLDAVTLRVAKNLAADTEEVASVVATLRSKGGFKEVNEDFEDFVDTAMKMSVVLDVNANEMAEFMAETTKGMGLSTKEATRFAVSLVNVQRQGGITFEQLRDTTMALKDTLRRLNLEQGQNLKIMQATAAAAQVMSANYGNAADAAAIVSAATNRNSEDYRKLFNLVLMSGEEMTGTLEELATQHPEKLFMLLSKGAQNFEASTGKAMKNFPAALEAIVGDTGRYYTLLRVKAEDWVKSLREAKKQAGKEQLTKEFDEMLRTVNSLKDRIANLFETIGVYLGRPLLKPLIFALETLLKIVKAIPEPVWELAGYLLLFAFGGKIFKGILGLSKMLFSTFAANGVVMKGAASFFGKLGGGLVRVRALTTAFAALKAGSVAALGTMLTSLLGIAAAVGAVGLGVTGLVTLLANKDAFASKSLKLFLDSLEEVKKAFTPFAEMFGKLFSGDLEGAAHLAEDFADAIEKAMKELPEKFYHFLSDLPALVEEFMTKGFDAFSQDSAGPLGRIGKAMLRAIWAVLKALPIMLLKAAGMGILMLVQGVWKAMLAIAKVNIQRITEMVASAFDELGKIPVIGWSFKQTAKDIRTSTANVTDTMDKAGRFGMAEQLSIDKQYANLGKTTLDKLQTKQIVLGGLPGDNVQPEAPTIPIASAGTQAGWRDVSQITGAELDPNNERTADNTDEMVAGIKDIREILKSQQTPTLGVASFAPRKFRQPSEQVQMNGQ